MCGLNLQSCFGDPTTFVFQKDIFSVSLRGWVSSYSNLLLEMGV